MKVTDRLRDNLELLLDDRGWNRAELARRLAGKVSRGYVYMIFAGTYDPSLTICSHIADAFGIHLKHLISENPLGRTDPNEETLIVDYRSCDETGRNVVRQVAAAQASRPSTGSTGSS